MHLVFLHMNTVANKTYIKYTPSIFKKLESPNNINLDYL